MKNISSEAQERIMGAISYGGAWSWSFSSKNPTHYGSFMNNWNPPIASNSSGGEIEGPGYGVCFDDKISLGVTTGGSIGEGLYTDVNVGADASRSCLGDVWSGDYDDNSDGVDDWSGSFDDPGSC